MADPKAQNLRRLLSEAVIRKAEALRLYKPMDFQAAFHASMAPERIIRGSNRAGKTLAAAVEIARAVTGQDPYGRYPTTNGICYCVAKDGREIAQVVWKKLAKPGAFYMIRDKVTNDWRSFDPTSKEDMKRVAEKRPSLPLIPKRFIKEVAWESKKESLPKFVKLATGWEIHFYSSNAKPARGVDIDLCWFNEEADDSDWYSETMARLIDRGGRFIWDCTPQTGSERLWDLHTRVMEEEENKVKPRTIEEYYCTIDGNVYIEEANKEIFKAQMSRRNEDYEVRVKGEYAVMRGRVFPEYNAYTHEVNPFPIPHDWTIYSATDPGRQVSATLFMAVPPPEKGDEAYLFKEIYLKNADATQYGQAMFEATRGINLYAALIDINEYRRTSAGDGRTVGWHYADALKRFGVKSVLMGSDFIMSDGSTRSVKPSIEDVRFWLLVRQNGTPKLRVFRTLENFVKEMKYYRYKKKPGPDGDFEEVPLKKRDHLIDCLRYLVQYKPQWTPQKRVVREEGAYKWFMDQKRKEAKKNGLEPYMMGPERRGE